MTPTAELIQPEIVELVRDGAYSELRNALKGIPPADIADIITSLEADQRAVCFRFLARDDAGEVFAYLTAEMQEELVLKLGDAALRVVEGMDPDDRARLIDELPPECAQKIVASLSPEDRKTTQAILGYPPKSVGRLMNPDYIRIMPDWTVGQALEHIRKFGRDAETINVVYVVDEKGVLIDDLRLRQILLADPGAMIETLMNRNFVALRADQPQDEAVKTMSRYDRVVLPVLDSRGVLLGIVTSDDVADVAEEEATEDMQKLGGMEALDEPYVSISIWRLVRKRGGWLAILFVGEMFTQTAMAGFEHDIERAAVLATFVPLIVSSGGNSGSQATSLIIRALAVGELTLRDWFKVLRRELVAGSLLGLFLGVIGLVRINVWGWMGWFAKHTGHPELDKESVAAQQHFHVLAVAIAVSVVGVVLWGTIIGAMLPFLLKRCRLDPATSSAPFVATLVDVVGVLIYFTAAATILRGTLL
ncbi:MAG TPA: magnesium transporter [Phycisphaerales bacterium]|nr:magnesium transporter [Phycisphaerales bacterium]